MYSQINVTGPVKSDSLEKKDEDIGVDVLFVHPDPYLIEPFHGVPGYDLSLLICKSMFSSTKF
jgi:hypothetical protein